MYQDWHANGRCRTKKIEQMLLVNADLFACNAFDMLGIDLNFIFHKLTIFLEAKPAAQRKCKIEEEMGKFMEAEIEKLLKANFI